MKRKLLIRDLTLRDGQQSLFATRMTQAQVDRVLPLYAKAGFYAMEVWGGAVPDSIMRYLSENPWDRLEAVSKGIAGASKLTALSRGRNLFGYAPYPNEVIDGFCRNAIESGLTIMRIFDALNDFNNIKSTISAVKKYGGEVDCAVCYTVDPNFTKMERLKAMLKGNPLPQPVFTDDYFIEKVKELDAMGADIITLKDMAGLVTPARASALISKMKAATKVPIEFHTHCTPGYGLASVFMSIVAGADIVDTNIWSFSGGPAAPAIELIDLFCVEADIELDVNMDVVREINEQLLEIRKELAPFDTVKVMQTAFDYKNIDPIVLSLINTAHSLAVERKFDELLATCRKIEDHYNLPQPNEIVKNAEIPGGMYTNMLAQLKSLKSEQYLDDAMKLIPRVRLDAGLPPLVTPTSQIVGAQAVSCALSLSKGNEMYAITSNQFSDLVKGQYGKTPIPVKPEFRKQITGDATEIPYDVSKFKHQPNINLEEFGGAMISQNEKDQLLLDLFPNVAKDYLIGVRRKEYEIKNKEAVEAAQKAQVAAEAAKPKIVFEGELIKAPLPGRILDIMIKVGDTVKSGETVIVLEAMKMENDIKSHYSGVIKRIMVSKDDYVPNDEVLIEFEK